MIFTHPIAKSIIAISMLFMSFPLWALNNWYHIPLTSQDGVGILIDYQFVGGIYEPYVHQKFDLVDNIWVNVHPNSSTLRSIDRVDARIFNYRRPRSGNGNGANNGTDNWELELSLYLKLTWNGSNFTGQWIGVDAYGGMTSRLPIASEGAMGNFEYRQEIVLTVYKDNTLYRLIDPISHSPYFKFSLMETIKR